MERNENGTLKKGNILNPTGRPIGSTNKANNELREFINSLIEKNKETISQDLQDVEPKERLKIILELLRFVLPILKSVDSNTHTTIENQEPPNIIINVIQPNDDV